MLAIVSDAHSASQYGLYPEKWVNLAGNEILANPGQRMLWGWWQEYWEEYFEIVGKGSNRRLSGIHFNGEFVEGTPHNSTDQVVTSVFAEQAEIAMEIWRPLRPRKLKRIDFMAVCRGTKAHIGDLNADEWVARELGVDRVQGRFSNVRAHYRFAGVKIDATHHISGSQVEWSRGNNARKESLTVALDALKHGHEVPNVCIRSHVHFSYDTQNNFPVRTIITPCWKLTDDFGNKVGRRFPDVGGAFLIIDKEGNIDSASGLRHFSPPSPDYREVLGEQS